MQPKSLHSCLGFAAMWLLLASCSLGAAKPVPVHAMLKLIDKMTFVCKGTFYIPSNDMEDNTCFIHELENVGKNCEYQNATKDSLTQLVHIIKKSAKGFLNITNSMNKACEQYRTGCFEDYRQQFKLSIQKANNARQ